MMHDRIVKQCAAGLLSAGTTLPNSGCRPVAECEEECGRILSLCTPLELRFWNSTDTHQTGDWLSYCDPYNGGKPVAPKVFAAQGVGGAFRAPIRAAGGRRGARLCAGRELAGLVPAGSVGRAAAERASGDAAVLSMRRRGRAPGVRGAHAGIAGSRAPSSQLAPSHPQHAILISRFRNGTSPIAEERSS